MTDFLAVYFMLQLAFALMVCVFIWRFWVLYLASGLCWGMVGIYSLIISHGGMQYVWAFSFFCIGMAFIMFFGNWLIPKKKMSKDEYSQFSTTEDWATNKEKKGFDKMWGKTATKASEEKEKQLDIEARRARGEWVNDEKEKD